MFLTIEVDRSPIATHGKATRNPVIAHPGNSQGFTIRPKNERNIATQSDIRSLMDEMNQSIKQADAFIETI